MAPRYSKPEAPATEWADVDAANGYVSAVAAEREEKDQGETRTKRERTNHERAKGERAKGETHAKRERAKRPSPPEATSRFRGFWIVVAGLYLGTVWMDGVGSNLPAKITPRPWLYFAQVAALFVNAAPKVIDYRAEGWSCGERRWTEVDVLPYFRIDADNKENRFQRALQFYRKNRTVMHALEDFLIKRNNASGAAPIGGVRFSSLRLSYPAPGEHVAKYEHLPLATYSGEQRHDWYWTPKSKRAERCGQRPDPTEAPEESERPRDPGNLKDNAPVESEP